MTYRLSDMIQSLRSTTCPACAREKRERKTLCIICYRKLPGPTAGNLYQRVGNGYDDAFAEAMRVLRVGRIALPGIVPDAAGYPVGTRVERRVFDGTRDPLDGSPETVEDDEYGDDDAVIVPFGRHAGKTLASILQVDPTYLSWLRQAAVAPVLAGAVGRFCDANDDEITAAHDERHRTRRAW